MVGKYTFGCGKHSAAVILFYGEKLWSAYGNFTNMIENILMRVYVSIESTQLRVYYEQIKLTFPFSFSIYGKMTQIS